MAKPDSGHDVSPSSPPACPGQSLLPTPPPPPALNHQLTASPPQFWNLPKPTQQQDLGARAAETGKEITHQGRGLTQRWGSTRCACAEAKVQPHLSSPLTPTDFSTRGALGLGPDQTLLLPPPPLSGLGSSAPFSAKLSLAIHLKMNTPSPRTHTLVHTHTQAHTLTPTLPFPLYLPQH